MKEVVMLAVVCTVPIALFWMAAWLMFNEVKGWGWFLIAVICITGSVNYRYTPDQPQQSEQHP